jgi:hypothetical protein
LELLNSYDADLRGDANRLYEPRARTAGYIRASARARWLIGGTPSAAQSFSRYPSSPQLRHAGARRLVKFASCPHRVHEPEAWVEQLLVAAKSQTVVVTGAETAAELVAELAEQPNRVFARRRRMEKEIERAFFNLPEASILKSLQGIGPRLGARILIEIGDIRQFRTSAHLDTFR